MVGEWRSFLPLWAGAFVALGIALFLLFGYFRVLGTDLSLNRLRQELFLALAVSAAQAGAVWFVLPFIGGLPHSAGSGRALFIIPLLFCLLSYKLAHLADWDQNEPLGLALFQFVVAYIGLLALSGNFGLAVFVLSGFMMVLLLVGAFLKQT
jgi:hypothetical protein